MGTTAELEALVERGARRRTSLVLGALRDGERTVLGRAGRAPGDGGTGQPRPPDGRSLFEVGSVTKTVTALLLADGVVRGDWALDTPVRALLPVGSVVPVRGGAEITLEHLATHRSGLPHVPVPLLRGTLQMLRGRDPYAGLTTARLLDALGRARLRRTPGSGRPHYSNLGAGVLGLALAHACGTSYGALVASRVCQPLGLADTVTHDRLDADQRERLVPGHRRSGRPAPPWPLDGMPGAGGLRSTAEDMLTYVAAQLDAPAGPLGEAAALTQVPRAGSRRAATGLGWMRSEAPQPLWWHNGGTGGYRSFVGFVPERRAGVVVLGGDARTVDLLGLQALRCVAGR